MKFKSKPRCLESRLLPTRAAKPSRGPASQRTFHGFGPPCARAARAASSPHCGLPACGRGPDPCAPCACLQGGQAHDFSRASDDPYGIRHARRAVCAMGPTPGACGVYSTAALPCPPLTTGAACVRRARSRAHAGGNGLAAGGSSSGGDRYACACVRCARRLGVLTAASPRRASRTVTVNLGGKSITLRYCNSAGRGVDALAPARRAHTHSHTHNRTVCISRSTATCTTSPPFFSSP